MRVFHLVGQGLRKHLIPDRLGLNQKTVESYRETMKNKFDLKNPVELLKHTVRWAKTTNQMVENK